MIYLQSGFFTGALKEDWAILVAILILAVVQIIFKIIDQKKDKRTQEVNARRDEFEVRRESVMDSIERYLEILSNKYTEEVTDIQMPVIVNEFVGHMKEAITVEAAASIARNNIKSYRKETQAKLEQFISNRYKDLVVDMGRFKWHGLYMSEFLDKGFKDMLTQKVITIVIKERDTVDQTLEAYRQLGSSMDQYSDQLKNSILSKAYER